VPGNKSYAPKAQNKGLGATKEKNQNWNFKTNKFLIYYIFVYIESFDSFHLDLL